MLLDEQCDVPSMLRKLLIGVIIVLAKEPYQVSELT